jgi:hypothetical protein
MLLLLERTAVGPGERLGGNGLRNVQVSLEVVGELSEVDGHSKGASHEENNEREDSGALHFDGSASETKKKKAARSVSTVRL